MAEGKIRILVADDHPMLREGLVAVLSTQPDFEVVGEAADGSETVRLAEALSPDVILLDLEMPGTDGVAALEGLRDAGSWALYGRGRGATCSRAPRGRRSSAPSAPSTPAARCCSPASRPVSWST
jgi:CheY-like chemotaxis protein